MTVIAQDQYVVLEYRMHLDTGEQIRGSNEAPAFLTFVAGYKELMPGLERRLWGLREQEAVEFVVPASEAFGLYEPENVQEWSLKVFPPEMDLKVGQKVLPANLPIPAGISPDHQGSAGKFRHPGYEPPPGRARSALSSEGVGGAAGDPGGTGTPEGVQLLLRRDYLRTLRIPHAKKSEKKGAPGRTLFFTIKHR